MNWIIDLMRSHPELAIYMTIALGFLIARIKFKGFSLGLVSSVLLVGVVMGQFNIPVSGALKQVAFLMFIFAVGYKVGPQFFNGLKKEGVPQLLFAVTMCLSILLFTWIIALIMGYGPGEAAGLLAGSQTISAVIGVADETIHGLGLDNATEEKMKSIIPVAYAVTYIFGTAGSAWIIARLGPRLMGGFDKVRAACKELEKDLGRDEGEKPGFVTALRPVVFRAYKVENEWFVGGRTVEELEEFFKRQGRRIFVERIKKDGRIEDNITPKEHILIGDEVVLTGRREYVIGEEKWIGGEILENEILDFPVLVVKTRVAGKRRGDHTTFDGKSIGELRAQPFMHGVSIQKITRAGVKIPILPGTKLNSGDILEIVGKKFEVMPAAKEIGYPDLATNETDMVFMAMGIFIGAIIGNLTLHIGNVPISLSSSGGVLIAGLVFGWWRARHPTIGAIPESALWIFNNLGLNIFIAIVGITAGPGFVEGFKELGIHVFFAGVAASALPLLFGLYVARHWFKFHPAIALGCCAGARTTTAALGALQETIGSDTPALGYTVTYAVGNTLLILWGVIIVLLCG